MKPLKLIIFLLIIIFCYSCKNNHSFLEQNSQLKRKWMLVEFLPFTKLQLTETSAYLDLSQDEEKLEYKMGCNTVKVDLKAGKNQHVKITDKSSTGNFCKNMELEFTFQEFTSDEITYSVQNHFLTLKNKDGKVAKFVAQDWD